MLKTVKTGQVNTNVDIGGSTYSAGGINVGDSFHWNGPMIDPGSIQAHRVDTVTSGIYINGIDVSWNASTNKYDIKLVLYHYDSVSSDLVPVPDGIILPAGMSVQVLAQIYDH